MKMKRLTAVITIGILAGGGLMGWTSLTSCGDSFFTTKARSTDRNISKSTLVCPHCGNAIRLSASNGSGDSDNNYYSTSDLSDLPSDNSQKVKTFSVGNFTKVQVSSGLPIVYVQGALKPVKIEGPRKVVDAVNVTEDNGMVTISLPSRNQYNTKNLIITLTSPNITDVMISNGSLLTSNSNIKTLKSLNITAKSGSVVNLASITASTLNLDIVGGSVLSLAKGNVDSANIDISGGSCMTLKQFVCKTFNCDASSGSALTVEGSAKKGNFDISGGTTYNGSQFDVASGDIDISGGSMASLAGGKLNVDCDKSSIVTGFSSKKSSKMKISK